MQTEQTAALSRDEKILAVLEQSLRWHQGDKFRDSSDGTERAAWEDHKHVLDDAIGQARAALATKPAGAGGAVTDERSYLAHRLERCLGVLPDEYLSLHRDFLQRCAVELRAPPAQAADSTEPVAWRCKGPILVNYSYTDRPEQKATLEANGWTCEPLKLAAAEAVPPASRERPIAFHVSRPECRGGRWLVRAEYGSQEDATRAEDWLIGLRAASNAAEPAEKLKACNFCLAQASEARAELEAYKAAAEPAGGEAATLTREHDIALREAHHIRASEDYFCARPKEWSTILAISTFEAGHKRGWEDRSGLVTPPQAPAVPAGLSDAPDRTGVYAWVTQDGHASLVLVSKRPTAHCEGGKLNAVVMESSKFYDGCAVEQWGKQGRWVLLHDFAAALAASAPGAELGKDQQ